MNITNFTPALLLVGVLTLGACDGLEGIDLPGTTPPLPESISVGDNIPEDITVAGDVAYVSSLTDGSVQKLDLENAGAASAFIPAATDAYTAAWGLRVVEDENWLLVVQNQPYDFNPANAQTGRLTAFDLNTGAQAKSWDLPEQMVGNSVVVDEAGALYVGDIGPSPRIVKIDPDSDEVSVWATSSEWVDGGFGVGGVAYSGAGLYASHNNLLWYIAVEEDGSAAEPVAVSVEGDPVIFADGITWTEDGIIYAENDVLVAGAQGAVYRLDFSDATTATRSTLQEGLRDPSGVAVTTVGEQDYLLVNESQLGFAFGVDEGEPSTPYQLKVFER